MRTDIIKIICDLPEDADEKYAGGLWDLAGLIQSICAGAEDDEEAQDRVYALLRMFVTPTENK